ncbi:MAG TPA: glycosyltransferase family 39 protein [Pirellulales bacterium]|nr:glycosyltransferase family 39 protein [Pirellulales bacterium]
MNALALAGMLAMHAGLLAYSAARHSPTFNELGHLPAGICHWQYAMFELYRVNPPLARMVAAAPVLLFCEPKTDWANYQLDPLSRETIPMGIRFAKANGPRTFFLFTVARWACIPFCLLGAWTCYRWACDLWGCRAGWIAMLLWCFNPFVLGFGALVKPDVPAAAVGVWAAYRFLKWLREPSWAAAAVAGTALGLAELTKFTLVVFFLIWPAAWLVKAVGSALPSRRRDVPAASLASDAARIHWFRRELAQLAAVLILAVVTMNFGYAFAGSHKRLGDFRFQSRILSGEPTPTRSASEADNAAEASTPTRSASKANHAPSTSAGARIATADPPRPGNRFAGTWLADLPVPLPRDYVQGIDRQRTDFELGERSYLRGRWQERGWWYYHLFGLAIKTPLGTLALLGLTICLTCVRALRRVGAARHRSHHAPRDVPVLETAVQTDGTRWPPRFADELFLLAPAVAILALVSSQTGFSNHMRYTIPALPYFFIWCGKCLFVVRASRLPAVEVSAEGGFRLRRFVSRRAWVPIACWLCVAATALASLSIYPHSISYFNLLVGGPKNGHDYLLESNIACGQDLLHLKEWFDRNPQARPLGVASFGWIDPELAGVEYTLPPVGPSRPMASGKASGGRQPPVVPSASRPTAWVPRREPPVAAADLRQHRPAAVAAGASQPLAGAPSVDDSGPFPGWYAIDVNFLHGTHWPAASGGWWSRTIDPEGPNFEYFRFFEPCDRVAYSFLIYHLTREDANRVRRELGLPVVAEGP